MTKGVGKKIGGRWGKVQADLSYYGSERTSIFFFPECFLLALLRLSTWNFVERAINDSGCRIKWWGWNLFSSWAKKSAVELIFYLLGIMCNVKKKKPSVCFLSSITYDYKYIEDNKILFYFPLSDPPTIWRTIKL